MYATDGRDERVMGGGGTEEGLSPGDEQVGRCAGGEGGGC
jgi:hypothetical protein